jgi:hypothetical protein
MVPVSISLSEEVSSVSLPHTTLGDPVSSLEEFTIYVPRAVVFSVMITAAQGSAPTTISSSELAVSVLVNTGQFPPT